MSDEDDDASHYDRRRSRFSALGSQRLLSGCGGFHRCIFFILFQRRNFNQGAFRIGAMHGVAVVSGCLLGEYFRAVWHPGTFRPSEVVAVQRDALNALGRAESRKTGATQSGKGGNWGLLFRPVRARLVFIWH